MATDSQTVQEAIPEVRIGFAAMLPSPAIPRSQLLLDRDPTETELLEALKAAFDGANSIDESQQAALDNPFNVPAGYRTTVARATGVAAEQHTDKASRGRQGHENAAQELYMKQPRRSKRGSPRGQVRTRPFWLFQNLVTKGADMSVFALCHSFQHVSCYRPTARIPVQSLSGCPERSVRSRAQGGDDVGRRW